VRHYLGASKRPTLLRVLGEEHDASAAAAELALDPLAVGQGLLQALRRVGQGADSVSLYGVNLAQHAAGGSARPRG
jgi:hypothetical protein